MSREILLLVDALGREKNVDKNVVIGALEQAMKAARGTVARWRRDAWSVRQRHRMAGVIISPQHSR